MTSQQKPKEADIGVVPEDWEIREIGNFINIKHGYAFKGKYFTDAPNNNLVLTPGNFNIGGGFKDDKFRYTTENFPPAYVLHEGDIVVTMTDLSKNGDTLGFSAKVPKSQGKKYLHNQRLGLLQFKSNEINKDFLYWVLRTKPYNRFVVSGASGSTVKHTSPSRIQQFKFGLPPIEEQLGIANVLSSLDDKIALNSQINAILEKIGQTLFRSWFIDFEFPNAKGKPYKSSGGEMVDSELGKIPKGWEVVKLDRVSAINQRSLTGNDSKKIIQYIDISSVNEGKLLGINFFALKDAPSRAKRLVLHGDIIWSCVRPNRRSYLYIYRPPENLVVSTGFAVLTPKRIPPSFLYNWVTTDEFVDYLSANADGSAYPAVRPENFASADILLPSSELLARFEEIISPMRGEIAFLEEQSQILSDIRDFLLPRLISGRIRVK